MEMGQIKAFLDNGKLSFALRLLPGTVVLSSSIPKLAVFTRCL
jgi:hypothetical protein